MKVLKFGGTSVGTVDSLLNVKKIVEDRTEPLVVVVSALGGITDRLIATARMAAANDAAYMDSMAEIRRRHDVVISELVPAQHLPEVTARVGELLDELTNIYKGISLIADLPQRTLDIIVSYGERLSSTIIHRILEDATLYDSRSFIKTLDRFGKHVLDNDATLRLVHDTFDNAEFEVALVPGFIASNARGEVTNLGRGGSDYTAAIIAAALDASVLEIWTDVDGFMTADPRLIRDARVIDSLSFVEAMELCNFGAKVIYPPTIYPVFHKNIPIYIKNTFNASAPGTLICEHPSGSAVHSVKGVSSLTDTSLVTLSGSCLVESTGVNSRIFNALGRAGVSVLLVSEIAVEGATSFAVSYTDMGRALDALSEEFRAELETGELDPVNMTANLATIAVVGDGMRHSDQVASMILKALDACGIEVVAVGQGSSDTTLSLVTRLAQRKEALATVHDLFFNN